MTTKQQATYDFDLHDSTFAKDPYPTYEAMRTTCPVTWSDRWGGFWAVSGYDAVSQVARDDATFSSAQGLSIPAGQTNMRPLIPIEIDPPQFQKYRRLVTPLFSAPTIAGMEDAVRRTTIELIDQFVEKGSADLVADLAQPMPANMFMEMLGFPVERAREFQEWVFITSHEQFHDFDKGVEAALNVYAAFAEAIEDRRDAPGTHDDAIEYLINAEIDGERLTDEEIMDFGFLLLAGGLDTTTSAIGNALRFLDEHREHRDMLLADPSLMPHAVEEFLRFEAPVQGLGRTVTADVELAGQQLKAGDKVWLLWAAANRDPAAFDAPDDIRFDRANNRHMSFGVGIHRCLGMHLGRLELRVALEEVLKRLPDYRVVSPPELHDDCSIVYGLTALHVEFTPGKVSL